MEQALEAATNGVTHRTVLTVLGTREGGCVQHSAQGWAPGSNLCSPRTSCGMFSHFTCSNSLKQLNNAVSEGRGCVR